MKLETIGLKASKDKNTIGYLCNILHFNLRLNWSRLGVDVYRLYSLKLPE